MLPTNQSDIRQWTTKDVGNWLVTKGFGEFAERLRYYDGSTLLSLNVTTLCDLGVPEVAAHPLCAAITSLAPSGTARGEIFRINNVTTQFVSISLKQMKFDIYLRDCYIRLLDTISTSIDSKSCKNFLILGNPGIGKSYFLLWLLYILLSQDKTVVLNSISHKQVLCFKGRMVKAADSVTFFEEELGDKDNWYLIDSIVSPGDYPAKSIFVSSPRKSIWKQFSKNEGPVFKLYMPLWTWSELKSAQEILQLGEPEVVEKLFEYLNGVPRFLKTGLESIEEVNKAITTVDLSKIMRAINQADSDQEVSRYLIQIVPKSDLRTSSISFLSPMIENLIISKWQKTRKNELLQFVRESLSPEFASLSHFRGFLFENILHNKLMAGGHFTTIGPLGGAETTKILAFPKQEQKWTKGHDNSKEGYYRPISKTFAAVDSWIGSVGFFNMTTAAKHPINICAMGELVSIFS
eukprot:TRINITY_DN12697_c0_g1_i1.p1 TRINITY_DN12697_c0_g1~~TRINITY_DN12697_c0_g1_i1.p1  ORF type:complete len:463 (+),score=44.98 TRINITY_DN12697_c0_g1_i1:79-1467(+)